MKRTKLFLLLQQLTYDEIKKLKKAVHSPIYTTDKRVKSLYKVLRSYYPDYSETQDFKKKIFLKIFPKEAFNDQKLRRVISQLREITEQFLLQEHINKNEYLTGRILANVYKERKLYDLYQQKTEGLMTHLTKHPCLDVDLLRERALLNKEYSYFNKNDFQKS